MHARTLTIAAAAALALSPPLSARPLPDPIAARAARLGPAASLVDMKELAGRWRVTGVAVADSPVQAYVANDPAYMGRVLTITPKRLAWAPGGTKGAEVADVCADPATQRLPRRAADKAAAAMARPLAALGVTRPVSVRNGHEIACLASGNWGPEAAGGSTLFAASLNRIAFTWYDGVVLRLDRVR